MLSIDQTTNLEKQSLLSQPATFFLPPFFSSCLFVVLSSLVLCFVLSTNVGWGQGYLGLDGGLEGTATVNNTVQTAAAAGEWRKNNASQTIANETSTVRSGANSLRVNNTSVTGRRVWSPLVTVSSTTSGVTIQYYRYVANTTNSQNNQEGTIRGATESLQGTYDVPASAGTWEKQTYSPTSSTFTTVAGIIIHRQQGTGGDMFIDDMAIYTGGVDNTAPNAPTSPNAGSATSSSLLVSWTAASGGVDNGGYLVVRHTADPTTAPNTNGIYAVNNTIGSGTVVYQGTSTSFTDNSLASGTTYYYRIYTYDKAYNYSSALTVNGITSSPSFIVTFNGNGNTGGSMSNQTASVATNLTSNSFTKTGYTFAGWNTAADGTGTSYADGGSYPFTSSTTLYAQWTLATTPTITATGTLSAVNTTYGTASTSPTSFSVSGSALTNDISISAPSGYEISTTSGTGYATSLTLAQVGGFVSSTTIYVRLAATTAVGSYSGNISLTSTGATTQNVATVSSAVSTKALTITGLSASNKVYDGNTSVTVIGSTAYSGLVNGESFSVTGTPSWAFADKTVNSNKTINQTGSYAAPSANYTVTQPTVTATITAKTITVTGASASNKVYDGTMSATISGTLSGVIAGDVVTLNGTGAFASANVGTGIVVTSSATLSGADAANYTLTQPTGLTANITTKSLIITANDVAKQYGSTLTGGSGSTAFISSGLVVPETIGSVTIAYGTGAASGDAVGTYSGQVTPSDATGGTFNASNYAITYVSGAINVSLHAIGDYRTRASGNWGVNTSWEKWDGTSWVACSSGDFPDVGTASVTIQNGHTIDNDGSGTPPWDVRNLTVESGAKLWDNDFIGGNSYIQVYGDIICDGTIGNPNGDDISFDIVGGNDCSISGTGSFTATRIRKDDAINNNQDATVTFDMDVKLTWSTSSGTVLYNDASVGSNFNVNINSGKSVRCSGPGSVACNVSIDGTNGQDGSNIGGTYTIHGTLDMDGSLYSLNNNSTNSTSLIIKNGGTVKCRYIETGSSGASGNTLRIESGGKLNIFGSVDTITATLNDVTWNGYSATNNTWDFQSGSTIEYSGATQQRVNGITSCSNFTVSGGGLKKLGNDFTVAGMLTLTSGRVQTDAYKLIHSSTAASDLTHTSGSASFVFGTYRRYLASNTSTYEMPVGLSSATAGYRRADVVNNNLSGLTYVDASVRSVTETGNNTDSRINCIQEGSTLTDIVGNSVWTMQPDVTPSSGTYGVRLYVNGTGLTAADDNTFCAVKRPDNSTDYADWNTFFTSTSIPAYGAAGRICNSGNGYAERLGYTSFSEHAIGKSPANQPLPVGLSSFEVSCLEEGKVSVKWSTSTENNSSHFVVERSVNGNTWNVAGTVAASGYSQDVLNYEFLDRSESSVSYYRLVQVDLNGQKTEYQPVSILCNSSELELVTLPNPSGQAFNIMYNAFSAESLVELQITDAQGKTLYSKAHAVSAGVNVFEITDFTVVPGTYFVKVTTTDGTVKVVRHQIF